MMVSTEDAYDIQGAFEPGYAAIYTVCPLVAGVITNVPSLYTFHLIDPLVPLLKSNDSEGIVGEVPVLEEPPGRDTLTSVSLPAATEAAEGYVAAINALQPVNALVPIVITRFIVMVVIAVLLKNAKDPISVTVSEIAYVEQLERYENASVPMY